MPAPKFPDDFEVLYTEGASYWWWSPFTDESFDGTVAAGEAWPEGLMVGCEETTSHELEVAFPVIVCWMNEELNPVETQHIEYYKGDVSSVQLAVDLAINNLVEDGYLVNLGDVYSRPSSVPS